MDDNNQIIIYQSEDGETRIEVKFTGETVWLSQQQLCELYNTSKANVSEHIKHIFEDGELDEESVVRKFRTTAADGKSYNVTYYNLDMIISLGYRIRPVIATHFRRWATERLKEYIIKGFTMDDERLKGNGGGAYWRELLDRIRDIRSSEKVMYRQVLDLYATAVDYDPRSGISVEFFKIVQNKLHFAAHGNTAAEVIFKRANADAPMMGLTSFKGDHPTLRDAQIAKNYLTEEEVDMLNRIVNLYLDFAELQAKSHVPMYMKDWIKKLDDFLTLSGKELLTHAGTVSAEVAKLKADTEYDRFRERTQYQLSPVEIHFLEAFEAEQKKLKGK